MRIGILLLIIFALFSRSVRHGTFKQFDFDITVKVRDHVSPVRYAGFSAVSFMGSMEIVSIALLIFLLARRRWQGLWVLGVYIFGLVVELFGKIYVPQTSPPFMFSGSRVDLGYSYPSGHTYRAAFLVTVLYLWTIKSKLNLGIKIAVLTGLAGWLFLMGLSRVTLGEHWPTDVIGGSLLGLGLGYMTSFIPQEQH